MADNSTSAAHTVGNRSIAVDKMLAEVQPEAMLVLGDTNSCLAVLPAKRRKIPVFHMVAGDRCFDQRVPEEINRRIVDHTADVNLTYSTIARDYLLRARLPPYLVIKTGSPMFEVLTDYRPRIDAADVLARLGLDIGQMLEEGIAPVDPIAREGTRLVHLYLSAPDFTCRPSLLAAYCDVTSAARRSSPKVEVVLEVQNLGP